MIVLDENYPREQREILRAWRIAVKQIGFEVGRAGMKDDELFPLLIQLPRPTFFTLDRGLYERDLRHARYSVVVLEVADGQAASFTRRVLKHWDFNTRVKRLGRVLRVSHDGITGWALNAESEAHWDWP